MVSFLTESGKDFQETSTVGGFTLGNKKNDFDSIYAEAANNLQAQGIDLKSDINTFIKDEALVESFKEDLLSGLANDCANKTLEEHGTMATLYEQAEALYDNCVDDLITESTRVGVLLPIKAVDLPLVIKQNVKCVSKDVLQTEVTKSPVIKKQIERTYVVDPETGRRWKYPHCFFNDEYKQIYSAGKGLPLATTPQTLPLYNFEILPLAGLDRVAQDPSINYNNHITINIQIDTVYIQTGAGTEQDPTVDRAVKLKRPMRVNLADNAWIGGQIDEYITVNDTEIHVQDVLSGFVDFVTNTTTLTSASGQIKKVSFTGNLSNENNERAVTWDYQREDIEFKIEDGFRTDVPYSLEELEDAKALLDVDLYKKTYNNLTELLTQMEDSQVFDWLDAEFTKYDGAELDALDFNPFISKRTFDCNDRKQSVALQSEYIAKQLKFLIDRFVIDIADKAKLDNLTFVIYGNPRFISLLDPNVNWVVKNGDMVGGIKLNYSYGIMTSGDVKIQVVSSYKINAKTHPTLRIIPFPIDNETFTFKHYKYTTHILTAANSAYRSPNLPGGSMTYLMGTSRYTNAAIQGIQGQVGFTEYSDFINLD